MLRINSTSLIEPPETSFVGQSESDCATPYFRNPWIDETSAANWMLQIECRPGHVFVFQGHGVERPDLTNADERSAFLRFVCHVLVEQLDKSGLEEACESLAEFFQYYRPMESFPPLQTAPNPKDGLVHAGALHRIMPSVEARPFRISED
jgi:hypothetical protein